MAIVLAVTPTSLLVEAQRKEPSMGNPTFHRAIQIDGLSIFYREAGPKAAPTILLLHGLPSSSRMFEPLFARLSDRYRLVAPDYPGFGHSEWPDPKTFAYTFDHLAEVMSHFTEALKLSRYRLYMQDYGGPVGFRMAVSHPDRIEALIVQDAVAHNDGLGERNRCECETESGSRPRSIAKSELSKKEDSVTERVAHRKSAVRRMTKTKKEEQ